MLGIILQDLSRTENLQNLLEEDAFFGHLLLCVLRHAYFVPMGQPMEVLLSRSQVVVFQKFSSREAF